MGDRRPFRFLATAVSGQSNQRRQDRWERSPADEESGQYLSQDGGQHATEKQHLSGSAVPPIQKQARVSHRDQGHGGQAGPIGVPHAAPRDEIRGPRSEVLRDPTPQPTDQTAQVESCQAGISSCPSSRSVTRESFWGAKSRCPDLLETLIVRNIRWSCWSQKPRLEGRRSIQLSYGRNSYVDSKSFIAKKNVILARLPSADRADAPCNGATRPSLF